jgi:hypothetical protein
VPIADIKFAALVVLCDGVKIETFDREVDITTVLRVAKASGEISTSSGSFLSRRKSASFRSRVVRQIDKVFDKEFNLRRVEEFRSLIEHRGRATRLRCPTLLCQSVRAGVL